MKQEPHNNLNYYRHRNLRYNYITLHCIAWYKPRQKSITTALQNAKLTCPSKLDLLGEYYQTVIGSVYTLDAYTRLFTY